MQPIIHTHAQIITKSCSESKSEGRRDYKC